MNVLIAINSNYLVPARVMLTSLFENNDEFINIYLLHSNLNKSEIEMLRYCVEEQYKGKLYPILVDKKQFDGFPISHHFTIETYYRFLAQSILPNDIDRILWLDADMIVNRSIKELYYQDFEDKYIVVCQSINKNPEKLLKKLGLKEDSKYFNAGTILFNLEKIRKNINPMTYFEYIQNNKDRITWLDQDVLNAIYSEKSKYVDYRIYNMQTFSGEKIDKVSTEIIDNNTAIIHYIGGCKPWNFRYNNYCLKFYWKYAKKSEGYIEYMKFKVLNNMYIIIKKLRGI